MRGGDVVGAHGDGGRVRNIPDIGGVRWGLDVCDCIGERELLRDSCGLMVIFWGGCWLGGVMGGVMGVGGSSEIACLVLIGWAPL